MFCQRGCQFVQIRFGIAVITVTSGLDTQTRLWVISHCIDPLASFACSCKQKKFSNEDMILALTGQFKQLSHEPEKFR